LQALQKEIALKRSDFEKEYQQRKTALDAREEAISGREKETAALQKEVESFPKRNEAAVQADGVVLVLIHHLALSTGIDRHL